MTTKVARELEIFIIMIMCVVARFVVEIISR